MTRVLNPMLKLITGGTKNENVPVDKSFGMFTAPLIVVFYTLASVIFNFF
jgi:hypothetical protein